MCTSCGCEKEAIKKGDVVYLKNINADGLHFNTCTGEWWVAGDVSTCVDEPGLIIYAALKTPMKVDKVVEGGYYLISSVDEATNSGKVYFVPTEFVDVNYCSNRTPEEIENQALAAIYLSELAVDYDSDDDEEEEEDTRKGVAKDCEEDLKESEMEERIFNRVVKRIHDAKPSQFTFRTTGNETKEDMDKIAEEIRNFIKSHREDDDQGVSIDKDLQKAFKVLSAKKCYPTKGRVKYLRSPFDVFFPWWL